MGHTVERDDIAPSFQLPLLANPSAQQLQIANANNTRFPVLSLEQYAGKVVYVDFWHSGCVPCRTSLPLLNDLRQRLAHRGFEVIGVNVDPSPREALDFLARYPVSFPVTIDLTERTLDSYQLQAFPTGYLIDRQGRVRMIHRGFAAADIHVLEAALENLLAATPDGWNQGKQQQLRGVNTTIRI